MAKSFVYEIVNKITGAVYVGKSNNPNQRFKVHMRASYRGSIYLTKAIKKYGSESFELNVISEFENEELAYTYERLRIEELTYQGNKLYNLCAGGRGIIMTPQLHEKMILIWQDPKRLKKISDKSLSNWKSLSFKNNISFKIKAKFSDPDFKKKHSDATRMGMTLESRKKISDTHKGRVQSAEERTARSTGCLRYWTEEKRHEHSRKLMCENNPNAKLCRRDVIKCRTLNELLVIRTAQIARILSLPNKATRSAVNSETWKDVLIKDENGNLTDEALTTFFELLGEFMNISPSIKTNQRVKLSPFGASIPKVLAAYEAWMPAQQAGRG